MKDNDYHRSLFALKHKLEAVMQERDQLRAEVESLKRACNLSRDALQEYDRLVANGDFYFNCKAHRSGPAQRAIDTAMNGGDVK